MKLDRTGFLTSQSHVCDVIPAKAVPPWRDRPVCPDCRQAGLTAVRQATGRFKHSGMTKEGYETTSKNFRLVKIKSLIILTLLAGNFSYLPQVIYSEEEQKEEMTVIESEIDFEDLDLPPPQTIKPRVSFDQFEKPSPSYDIQLNEKEIIHINRSLKKMIEENEKLIEQNKELDRQLKELRGRSNFDESRLNSVLIERDAFKQQNENIVVVNQQYLKEIEDLKEQLDKKEEELAVKIKDLKAQLAQKEKSFEEESWVTLLGKKPTQGVTQDVINDKNKSTQVISMLDHLSKENERLKNDEAKIHYNMGNIYFHQGKYKKAVGEYRQALHLTPQDPNAHYNLAFVSGEFLQDLKTALNHYRQYLALRPGAQDSALVEEKILEAELILRTQIPSSLEEDIKKEMGRVGGAY